MAVDAVLSERFVLGGYKNPNSPPVQGLNCKWVWKTANNQITAFKDLQKAWRAVAQDHLNHFKKVWDEMKDD